MNLENLNLRLTWSLLDWRDSADHKPFYSLLSAPDLPCHPALAGPTRNPPC